MSKKAIRVVDYDTAWADAFLHETQRLRGALGESVLDVQPIGSTAVPGLAAKPVIDILLVVRSLAELDAKEPAMIALGYQPKGEYGIRGRRYYQLGGAARTHQVHSFVRGDRNTQRHLAFRDYLRMNHGVAAEYAQIKRAAAEACNGDSEIYRRMKDEFIKAHERLALIGND
ncbi:MAG: GrpB family protein [Dokdonella sp.]